MTAQTALTPREARLLDALKVLLSSHTRTDLAWTMMLVSERAAIVDRANAAAQDAIDATEAGQ